MVTSAGGLGTWQPAVEISDAIFTPGAPVAMAKSGRHESDSGVAADHDVREECRHSNGVTSEET
jgi:hypothetical protein